MVEKSFFQAFIILLTIVLIKSMKSFLSKLINYFVRGLLLLAPLSITIYIIYQAFIAIDSLIPIEVSIQNSPYRLYGTGLLLVVVIILSVGFLGSTFFIIPVSKLVGEAISRIPLVGIIYLSIKDLINAFVGDKKKFNQAVLFCLNKENDIHKLGFITQKDLGFLDKEGFVMIYSPHSYAFSGETFIIPRANVKLINLPSSEVMKLIVSGGVSQGNA